MAHGAMGGCRKSGLIPRDCLDARTRGSLSLSGALSLAQLIAQRQWFWSDGQTNVAVRAQDASLDNTATKH